MNRDSEVIHDLVTSKYKIAERNRLAKYKFLTSTEEMNTLASKHRGSEPSLAQTEKAEVKKVDLSVPGTPVSSRYLESLGKFRRNRDDIETDDEDDDDTDGKGQDSPFHSALTEGLKQFTSDMEKLQQSHDKVDPKKEQESPVLAKKEEKSGLQPQNGSNSDTSALPKKEQPQISRIEKYFQESARRGSLTRDFTEVVQTFDPKILHDEINVAKPGTPVSSKLIKAEKISSKKLQPFTDNMKKLEALKSPEIVKNVEDNRRISDVPPEKPKRLHPVPLTPSNTEATPPPPSVVSVTPSPSPLDPKDFPPISSVGIKPSDILIIIEKVIDSDDVEANSDSEQQLIEHVPEVKPFDPKDFPPVSSSPLKITEDKPATTKPTSILAQQKDKEPESGNKASSKPTESNPPVDSKKSEDESMPVSRKDLSVPGTPVDSRKIFNTNPFEDDSDLDSDIEVIESSEIKDFAKDLVGQIEIMVQNTMKDEDVTTKKEPEKTAEEKLEEEEEGDKLLIISEDNSKVKKYFDKSEKEKSYQRTFSEIENFNEPTMDVKEKVEKYFKESEEKKSLTRGFSEAINYLEPVNIEQLFTPGTPVSSKVVESLKVTGEIEEEKEIDPLVLQGMEAFKKAHEALHPPPELNIKEYFEESKERHTLKRDFSEVYGVLGAEATRPAPENPEIKKFFEQSDAQKSFHRQFSEAVQILPPRIKDILPDEKPPLHIERSSRCSVFSAPDPTETRNMDSPSIARKHGKKYGIDKYFAASLYRTAYHRSKNQRRGSEPDHRFAIVEDEYVFGENDVLRAQVFQDDDQTPIHPIHHKHVENDGNEEDFDQQNVQFWRDFLKPYTLNLPSDIVMRDELIDKYTKYTLD